MRVSLLALSTIAFLSLPLATGASAETYEEYLSRLRDVCSVECLQPKDLQRTARRRDARDDSDMAVIMDVAEVRRNGSKFELLNLDLSRSPLEDLAILDSAGINTSSRNGVGGLPRGRDGGISPNVIIIEIDEPTLFDIINASPGSEETSAGERDDGAIVVEGDIEREVKKPSLVELRSYFRNRRIVVRGTPRLAPVFIGARRDFRRKQVTIELGDADNLVLLPRYVDGRAILPGDAEF